MAAQTQYHAASVSPSTPETPQLLRRRSETTEPIAGEMVVWYGGDAESGGEGGGFSAMTEERMTKMIKLRWAILLIASMLGGLALKTVILGGHYSPDEVVGMYVPDDVLRNFERTKNLREGVASKQNLFEVKCGATTLPSQRGTVQVALEKQELLLSTTVEREQMNSTTMYLPPVYKGSVIRSGRPTKVLMLCDANGFAKEIYMTVSDVPTSSLLAVDVEYPGILASVGPEGFDKATWEVYHM